jgi:hypothetical protein
VEQSIIEDWFGISPSERPSILRPRQQSETVKKFLLGIESLRHFNNINQGNESHLQLTAHFYDSLVIDAVVWE